MPSSRTRTPRAGNPAHRASVRALPIVNETSTGGLVVDVQNGQVFTTVIARHNRGGRLEWCLPEGHLEGAETPEQAVVREIMGETGITGRVLRHLATIDYWFIGHEYRVHKVVRHFLLEAVSGTLTTENDPGHEAEDAEWVAFGDVSHRLTYPNERRIATAAWDILVRDGWQVPPPLCMRRWSPRWAPGCGVGRW